MLGLLFWALPFTQGLARFSFDLPFALRSEIPTDEVLIVYMDDESRTRLVQPVQGPWNRALHEQLLNKLFEQHAQAVIFDVLFDEAGPDKSVDEQFAAAINARGKVVLGASCQYSQTESGSIIGNLRKAVEPLGSSANWGVAEMPLDSDGIIRRHFYDEQYTNIAWSAAATIGKAPGERAISRWINFYGPKGTIPQVSYQEVLQSGKLPANMFSNRMVFVGMAPIITYQGSRSSDEFATPYTKWTGVNSPGVEIQATAALNLIRGDWLSRLSKSLEVFLILAGASIFGFLLPGYRMTVALALGGMFALIVFSAAVLLHHHCHLWLNWAVIAFVQTPAALGWIVITANQKQGIQQMPQPVTEPTGTGLSPDGIPQIPEHELIRPFGEGSYGQVWLAKSTLGTFRAVKVVFRKAFDSDGPFDREFRGMQTFEPLSRSHDGFVDILQVGRRQAGGYFYYIMELADDQTLGRAIKPEAYNARTLSSEIKSRKKIPCEECVSIGMKLADALQHLHEAGLIHRDIKPSNIIFVSGNPKLADIGLVTGSNEAKSFVGTQGFIPPEGPGHPQADVYSLGKVLYELAMGRDRCSFPELPTTLAEDPDLKHLMALNKILIKACEDNPSRRYSSAEKMHADLKRLANRMKSGRPKSVD